MEDLKAALAKILRDQNGMANSDQVVEAIVELIEAMIEKERRLIELRNE